ncbi:MAG TPA: S1/P1 nuclease [Desulfobacterales bacterium]|nr:S1/P1 nuclease [Desulfobacterales bacterium]
MKTKYSIVTILAIFFVVGFTGNSYPWHDETHMAIAKAAGYKKWYNSAGADMIKTKAMGIERPNHYVSNPRETMVMPEMVFRQIKDYNKKTDVTGHLYGAIIASIRDYLKEKHKGKYGEYHLAFCAHYVGDLSQPLHNTLYNAYNRKNHATTDSIINDAVFDNMDKIRIYPIKIRSEEDLAKQIARIANLSIQKGYQIEDEKRLLTEQEAYVQIGHSASLFRAILRYVERIGLQ